jgi:hypothetical protein
LFTAVLAASVSARDARAVDAAPPHAGAHDAAVHDAGAAFESLPVRERGQLVIAWLDAGNGAAIYEHCAADAKESTWSPCGLGAAGMAAWARDVAAKCGAIASVDEPIVTGEHTQYDLYSRIEHREGCAERVETSVQFDAGRVMILTDSRLRPSNEPPVPTYVPPSPEQSNASLVVVALVTLLAILATIVLIFFIVTRRQAKQGREWALAAQQLGLRLAPFDARMLSDLDHLRRMMGANIRPPSTPSFAQAMLGPWRGWSVVVCVRQEYERSALTDAQQKVYYTTLNAVFAAPLHLGLRVEREGAVAGFFGDVFGRQDIRIGHPPFDQAFRVQASDPARAQALLFPIANELLQAASVTGNLAVNDSFARIEVSGVVTDPATLARLLDVVARVAAFLSPQQAYR